MAIDIYDGVAWQELANDLCILKYNVENYQKIPDLHRGDWGIEGYTLDGIAFQCYAPKTQHATDHQVKLQKDKINKDLNKFIANGNHLAPLVANGKYRRWFFLTTVYESRELPAYCARKTVEVKKVCTHVTDDFAVMAHDANDFFLQELPTYLNLGKNKISVPVSQISDTDIDTHKTHNPGHLGTIEGKLLNAKVMKQNIEPLAIDYLKDLIAWNMIKENLKRLAPDLALKVEKRIWSLEQDVIKKYRLKALKADELEKELASLRASLIADIESLVDSTTIDFLSRGIIADWLTRCPINF